MPSTVENFFDAAMFHNEQGERMSINAHDYFLAHRNDFDPEPEQYHNLYLMSCEHAANCEILSVHNLFPNAFINLKHSTM